jgi:hypothetical protein
MKRVFIIAAVLIAALPMAHASTYLFTSGTVATSETVGSPSITVWGFITASGGTGTSIYLDGSPSNLSYNGTYGLGVAATSNVITPNSFVVIDFSNPKAAGATTATIYIDNATSWIIYGGTTAPVTTGSNQGISGLTQMTSGVGSSATVGVSIASYRYLAITAGSVCHLDILKIDTNNVPEPGTFVMAGMALIGLGVGLRKVCKRS